MTREEAAKQLEELIVIQTTRIAIDHKLEASLGKCLASVSKDLQIKADLIRQLGNRLEEW